MRAVQILWLNIVFMAFSFAAASAQAAPLNASPSFIDFGPSPIRPDPLVKSLILSIDPQREEVLCIQRASPTPNSPFSASLPAGGIRLTPQRPSYKLDVRFTAATVGASTSELTVVFVRRCDGQAESLVIKLAGQGVCTDLTFNCDPIGPLCTIDVNAEWRLEAVIEDLPARLAPPLQRQAALHFSAVEPGYELPLNFLWESTGLDALISDPQGDCCQQIKITRIPGLTNKAAFEWMGTRRVLVSPDPPLPTAPQVTLEIPSSMKGFVNVGAGYTEFHFDDGAAPHVRFAAANGTGFNDDLICMSSTLSQAALRREGGGTERRPNIAIVPKP